MGLDRFRPLAPAGTRQGRDLAQGFVDLAQLVLGQQFIGDALTLRLIRPVDLRGAL